MFCVALLKHTDAAESILIFLFRVLLAEIGFDRALRNRRERPKTMFAQHFNKTFQNEKWENGQLKRITEVKTTTN